MARGGLLKHFRPALLLLAVAVFSASAWADGIDPKVIIQKGSGSTPITVNNPNPSFGPVTATQNSNCLAGDFCVFEVYQNQTSQTLHTLTIAINDLTNFAFQCGDLSQISFFSACSASDNGHVTDVTFSGGTGILPAVQQCVSPTALSSITCQKVFVGGEFGLLIDATASEIAAGGTLTVSGNVLTTPEPHAGILILSAALAFGLLKLLRRGA